MYGKSLASLIQKFSFPQVENPEKKLCLNENLTNHRNIYIKIQIN